MPDDAFYMQRCIELAMQAVGRTSPNPMVGSVVLDPEGRLVGEGLHRKAGQGHAEVEALDHAGDAARGGTIYVSLEPCCHFGKTPPCSDRVIASGISRVVCGMTDPNPKVAGGGVKALRAAGIEVTTGVLESECRYLNRAFLKWIENRIPWLSLKLAATLDGKIADRERRSKWISGAEARAFVQQLRNETDAVMIGAATAIQDDAQLTVRDIEGGRNPIRVILDPQLRIDPKLRVAQNPDGNTWIFASEQAIDRRSQEFGENVRLIASPWYESNLDVLWIMKFLGQHGILSVLCEGGGKLASALLPFVDEVYWIAAPKFLNDTRAIPALGGTSSVPLSSVQPMQTKQVRQLGDDVLFHLLTGRKNVAMPQDTIRSAI